MGYSIGQFAGLYQVSKKTLRYYKDIALLEPAGVDPVNGYAFYEDEQLERMQLIQYLRRLRFSLEEIKTMLNSGPESWIGTVQAQLAAIRSERQLLHGVEHELLALETRIGAGEGLYRPVEETVEYQAELFQLTEPLYLIGRAVRVPYSTYDEKQKLIDHLISEFFGNDEPGRIPNHAVPAASFGLVCECDPDMSMGTYMMGTQVASLDEIPEGMRSFTLPAGQYVRVTFRAGDRETLTGSALEGAYNYLYNTWLPESPYAEAEMLAAEVYMEDRMGVPVNPGMELWQLVVNK